MSQQAKSPIDPADDCDPTGFATSPVGGVVITPDPITVENLIKANQEALQNPLRTAKYLPPLLTKDVPMGVEELHNDTASAPVMPRKPVPSKRPRQPANDGAGFNLPPLQFKRSTTSSARKSAFSNIDASSLSNEPTENQGGPLEDMPVLLTPVTSLTSKKVVFEDAAAVLLTPVTSGTSKKVVFEDAAAIKEAPPETTKKVASEDPGAIMEVPSETTKKVASEDPGAIMEVPSETTKKVASEDPDAIIEVPSETTKKVASEDSDAIMEVPSETTKKVASEDSDAIMEVSSETTMKVASETTKEEDSETTKEVASPTTTSSEHKSVA
jgi:hypothetical protein